MNRFKSRAHRVKRAGMNRDWIMQTIRMLSRSQGMYGRLLNDLEELKAVDPGAYDDIMSELEAQNFADEVDLVMYLEEESDLMAGEIIWGAKRSGRPRKAMRKRAYETDKKTFVEGVLTDCLRETREQVDYCAYYRDGGEEYITIVFENGQSTDVNVTASSNLAMLYDVCKALM